METARGAWVAKTGISTISFYEEVIYVKEIQNSRVGGEDGDTTRQRARELEPQTNLYDIFTEMFVRPYPNHGIGTTLVFSDYHHPSFVR